MSTNTKLNAAIYAAIDPPILPEGTHVIRRTGWYQHVNPRLKDASVNEVILSQIPSDNVAHQVRDVLALYRKDHLPFKWAIGPMSSPSGLETTIAPLASASWEFRGMSIDTDAHITSRPEVSIEPVDSGNFADFLRVHLEGWGLQEYPEQTRVRLARAIAHPQYRYFLARKDSQAIGVAGTILKGHYGYLVAAVILEKYRGCGAYKALVRARLQQLRSSNIAFAVSQARESTSAPILEKIGFETLFRARIYKFDAE